MPARLLAYGGTRFVERRRIGAWPSIPEATLSDEYGLKPGAWCYGMGVLSGQPFLIFRQRQHEENRGGYPFTLLLDPGEGNWERFGWNGAALAGALLAGAPDLLFETPESCSSEGLERFLSGLAPGLAVPGAAVLKDLLWGSLLSSEAFAVAGGHPEPGDLAGAVDALPLGFRSRTGWLAGGGVAHGRAFGANLVLDDRASQDATPVMEAGRQLAAAWAGAEARGLVDARKTKPTAELLAALLLLREIETAAEPSDELMTRVADAGALQDEIGKAAVDLMLRSRGKLGPVASAALIGVALGGKRKIEASVLDRVDPAALRVELRRIGSPPKKIPKTLPVGREMRVALWCEFLDTLRSDVRKNLAEALDQLGPNFEPGEREALVGRALAALPGSSDKLADWKQFQRDPETWALIEEALKNEATRRSPKLAVAEPPKRAGELRKALAALLFESSPEEVDEDSAELLVRFEKINTAAVRAEMDDVVDQGCESACARFAGSFFGHYAALGDTMIFLTDRAQNRLMECLQSAEPERFPALAARHLNHALNNPASRNSYTRALSRLVLKSPGLRKMVAMELGELPEQLVNKIERRTLRQKGGLG